jgi:hypothetical protein
MNNSTVEVHKIRINTGQDNKTGWSLIWIKMKSCFKMIILHHKGKRK